MDSNAETSALLSSAGVDSQQRIVWLLDGNIKLSRALFRRDIGVHDHLICYIGAMIEFTAEEIDHSEKMSVIYVVYHNNRDKGHCVLETENLRQAIDFTRNFVVPE